VRCAGHIINLVVKAIIYGQGVSEFEQDLAQAGPREQFKLFRKRGVVGRLHNFVTSVLASHKRKELFMTIQRRGVDDDDLVFSVSLNLVKDGGIRWNSVYKMLLRCYELRDSIDLFFTRFTPSAREAADGYNPFDEPLTASDWGDVKRLIEFLQHFHDMTTRLEGNAGFGSLWKTLPHLQLLDRHINNLIDELAFEPDSFLKKGVVLGHEKLNTYWKKLIFDGSSPYIVATALHPKLRGNWFADKWRKFPDYVKQADACIRQAFEVALSAAQIKDDDDVPTVPPRARNHPGEEAYDEMNDDILEVDESYLYGAGRASRRQAVKSRLSNELDTYLSAEMRRADGASHPDLVREPMAWWHRVGRQRYPLLYKMALNYLSIPATSCECERCFSAAKRTITDDRNHLSPQTIEALQLQKNWLLHGVVQSHLTTLAARLQTRERAEASSDGHTISEDAIQIVDNDEMEL
jgi:hypothetical protein